MGATAITAGRMIMMIIGVGAVVGVKVGGGAMIAIMIRICSKRILLHGYSLHKANIFHR